MKKAGEPKRNGGVHVKRARGAGAVTFIPRARLIRNTPIEEQVMTDRVNRKMLNMHPIIHVG